MRGLYRYLSPFSPDQSGAVSVLYELGGLIVVLDAGGCAGNVCCCWSQGVWLHERRPGRWRAFWEKSLGKRWAGVCAMTAVLALEHGWK